VIDGNSGLDWTEFVLNVVKGVVEDNQPPIITTIDRVTATADVLYEVDYEATDDRTSLDLLTWQLKTDAIWLSLATSTGVLSGTPVINDVGPYWINVTVDDGEGGFDSHNFTLTVYSEANNPPEIITEDVINAVVGELYSVDYEADDDRTPVVNLQWSLKTNASNWLGIDKGTGILSGVPELEEVGSYWVEVTVFDGEDGWDFTNFTLYITREPITDFKPELNNPSVTPTIGNTETLFILSVEYSHPKGDPPDSIQVVIDDIAYDLIYNTNSDLYEYRMKLNEGAYTYYFTTTLGEHIIQTEAASIIVRRAPGIQPDDGDEDGGKEDNTLIYAIIGIIVIIIVVLILLFIFLKKKKKEEQQVEEAQSQQSRPIKMPLVFQPPAQEQYQYQQSLPPFPMVTPQAPQPQVEPAAPTSEPMPQVLEQPTLQPHVELQQATEEE
jgi:LPXTG-motif cell wall-anchored protein